MPLKHWKFLSYMLTPSQNPLTQQMLTQSNPKPHVSAGLTKVWAFLKQRKVLPDSKATFSQPVDEKSHSYRSMIIRSSVRLWILKRSQGNKCLDGIPNDTIKTIMGEDLRWKSYNASSNADGSKEVKIKRKNKVAVAVQGQCGFEGINVRVTDAPES